MVESCCPSRPLEEGGERGYVREILQAVADHIHGRAAQQGKPMPVKIEIPEGVPPLPGDRDRVIQIILALAENAFNYSEPNALVRMRVRPEAGGLQIEVADSGIGIAPDERARLFDRFYRGENPLVLKTPGSGLGLAMARQLAELHGGRVWLEDSEVGRGSTFAVWLPLD